MKNCRNCGHRAWDKCMLSGYYTSTERTYPVICKIDFQGWTQRPGILNRIVNFFYNKNY